MDILWYGQACFKIKGKNASLIVDPFEPTFTGLKLPKDMDANIVLTTHSHQDHSYIEGVTSDPVVVNGPGEYEIKGVSIVGVSTWHDKTNGQERGKNNVYNMLVDGINIVHLGDLGSKLTEEQLADIGQCDILMIPVGGTYTIDAKEAAEVVTQLEPRVVIPMHYGTAGLKFPLSPVEDFLKELGAENISPQPKLNITKDKLPEDTQVIVLTKV